jgi:hypothetical protein
MNYTPENMLLMDEWAVVPRDQLATSHVVFSGSGAAVTVVGATENTHTADAAAQNNPGRTTRAMALTRTNLVTHNANNTNAQRNSLMLVNDVEANVVYRILREATALGPGRVLTVAAAAPGGLVVTVSTTPTTSEDANDSSDESDTTTTM